MGFFSSLFGSKKKSSPESDAMVKMLMIASNFSQDLLKHTGGQAFEPGSMERQAITVYLFGGIRALCSSQGLDQTATDAIAFSVVSQLVGSSSQPSESNAEAAIRAMKDHSSPLNYLIPRGADGFLEWQKRPEKFDASDLRAILARMRSNPNR